VTCLYAWPFAGAAPVTQAARSLPQAAPPVEADGEEAPADPLPPGAIARLGTARFRHCREIHCLACSPDGKTLASGEDVGRVHLWEVETMARRGRFTGHRDGIHGVAFSPDGRRLVSASVNTTLLVWDVTGQRGSPLRALTGKELRGLWDDLGDEDAVKAHAALWKQALAPGGVKLLKERLRPVSAVDGERVARLIRDLDDDNFKVRVKATEELEGMGGAVAGRLRKVLRLRCSAEVRWRVEYLLERLDRAMPEMLRRLRALEALEHAGTAEARGVLQALAKGEPEARLTREAKDALRRLANRPS
jgi:hypothetical protein